VDQPKGESIIEELLESLREPLQLLLIGVGVLSAIWGELRDAIAIFGIIGLVAGIETATEIKAHRALDALRSLAAPLARVFRDGGLIEIPVSNVVAGDIVALEAGDVVPADCRILTATGLAVDESALTGEAEAVYKGELRVAPDAPLSARTSMAYAGTAAVVGEASAVVVATGGSSELGKLGRLVTQEREPQTPLQRSMAELARAILFLAISASVLVPAVGVLRGQPLRQMLLAGLVLAFATIPEELPILVTLLLAIGGRRLAKRGALLRKLRAAETLGGLTVVITDKTGTLTENRLELHDIRGDRARVLQLALAAQNIRRQGVLLLGDPVEIALAQAASDEGAEFEGEELALFAFDPQRKRMSKTWRTLGDTLVAAKGAPEAIMAVSTLTGVEQQDVIHQVDEWADEGLRVIAFAERLGGEPPTDEAAAETGLTFVGLAAMQDPLRTGVNDAVARLREAGVRTLMVTGDHPRTAAAVAKSAGMPAFTPLLGGAVIEAMSEEDLRESLRERSVVARATPADKLRIVRLLQADGQVVGVTGDGVNDAPALAAADVGIAMGRRGTDLAREAADLVLTDDSYPTVAAAVEGGRAIGSQLRRAVAFYLGAKLALIAVVGVPLILGLPSPFAPVHIVLLELFMDLGASTAFVSEPPASGVMRRPPRDPGARFLDRAESTAILASGLAILGGVLPAYLLVRQIDGTSFGPSAAVATWLIGHAFVAWSIRARPALGWRENFAFPAWAFAASLAGVLLAGTPVGRAFGLIALDGGGWIVVLAGVVVSTSLAMIARRTTDFERHL